uniref:CMRF35-like molecule 9 isoform X2 n=1 Tax=Gasterosteus aculeatus aculeatus TaxID=481459 RepID=UPI001A99799D|nr:CMRF35-like molecule 9 isoform X2 [Gasterosteus aculeatus aculeatus]
MKISRVELFCILSGLSVVQMKPLNINGRVGKSVKISCSDWTYVTENVKYFCYSPCTEDRHIIIKAAYGKIENKNGIKLYNQGKTLFVTFSNLQKSYSKTYYCGAERFGFDAYIEVILNVTDAPPPSPSMTPQTVTVVPTSSFTKSSTMSSNSSDVITDTSTSYTTFNTPPAAPAQGSVSYVLYLVIGVIVVIIILIVSLKLVNKLMKQQSSKIHIKIKLKYTLQIFVYFSQASTRQINK